MPEAGCWKKTGEDRPASAPKKSGDSGAPRASTPFSGHGQPAGTARAGKSDYSCRRRGGERDQGAGPSLTTPPRGPRGSLAAARRRAPRSYLGGREGGGAGGGGRRAAGTRLLLLGRVVQQNFAALVELPHGGRGGGGSRPSSSRQREGRGGSGRCLRSPGRGGSAGLGTARLSSAGLSPRRGLPGREEERCLAVPGARPPRPPRLASPVGLLPAATRRAAAPAPPPRLAAEGSRE